MSDSFSTGRHVSTPNTQDQSSLFAANPSVAHLRKKRASQATEARAGAQRRKVDSQRAERARRQAQEDAQPPASLPVRKPKQAVSCTWARDAYLQDHIGGNRSPKTVEWHRTALTFFCSFLEEEHQITLVEEINAIHITSWFAMMRTTPASHGRVRGERTIQTYARSVRTFFHWLQRRRLISFVLDFQQKSRLSRQCRGRSLLYPNSSEVWDDACCPSGEQITGRGRRVDSDTHCLSSESRKNTIDCIFKNDACLWLLPKTMSGKHIAIRSGLTCMDIDDTITRALYDEPDIRACTRAYLQAGIVTPGEITRLVYHLRS